MEPSQFTRTPKASPLSFSFHENEKGVTSRRAKSPCGPCGLEMTGYHSMILQHIANHFCVQNRPMALVNSHKGFRSRLFHLLPRCMSMTQISASTPQPKRHFAMPGKKQCGNICTLLPVGEVWRFSRKETTHLLHQNVLKCFQAMKVYRCTINSNTSVS